MYDNIKPNCDFFEDLESEVLESAIYLPEVSLPDAWCGWSQIKRIHTMVYWQDLVRRKPVKIQEIFIWSISALFIPDYLAWVLCSFSHKHDTSCNFLCHAVCKRCVYMTVV